MIYVYREAAGSAAGLVRLGLKTRRAVAECGITARRVLGPNTFVEAPSPVASVESSDRSEASPYQM